MLEVRTHKYVPWIYKGGGGINLLRAVFFSILLFFLCLLCQVDAQAMTKHTIPRKVEGLGAYYPGNDFGRAVDLSMRTYSRHEWHGINGTTMVSTHESPNVANTKGAMLFMIPTTKSGFEYQNCLTIYFNGVGRFQGRSLNARLDFTSIKFGEFQMNGKYPGQVYDSNPNGVFLLQSVYSPELFFGRSDQQEWFPGLEQRFEAIKDITMQITITYADTGAVVDIPFYHYVDDIDDNNVWNTYGAQEGVTFGSGYRDDLYVYDAFRCSVNGRTVKVPNDGKNHNYSDFYMPPPVPDATRGEATSNEPRVKEASWFCNACWSVTNNGQFSVTFHGSNAVTTMNLRSPFLETRTIKPPEKHGQVTPKELEVVHWRLSQYLPSVIDEILYPFSSLVFEDTLPVETNYQSARVFNKDGADITSQADISYDSSTRKLRVSLKSGWLSNTANYGGDVTIDVTCDWADSATKATNTCTSTINGMPPQPSNPVTVNKPVDKTNIRIHKEVLNKKETYGPGDIVEYLVVLDTASFPSRTIDVSDYFDFYRKQFPGFDPVDYAVAEEHDTRDRVSGTDVMTGFCWEDVIPEGLEVVGEPKVSMISSWKTTSSGLYDENYRKHISPNSFHNQPYTYEELLQKSMKEGWASGYKTVSLNVNDVVYPDGSFDVYSREGTIICHQPYEVASRVSYDPVTGLYDVHGFANEFLLYPNGFEGFQWETLAEAFSNSGSYNFHLYDYVWGNSSRLGSGYPTDLWSNYGYQVSVTKNRISVTSDNNTMTGVAWSNDGRSKRLNSVGLVGIYYQCRVTGSKTNADVTNVTKFNCNSTALMSSIATVYSKNWIHDHGWDMMCVLLDPVPLSAEASATIHIGGYQVTTEVVNGTIDDDLFGLSAGDTVSISYVRDSGYYLKSIEVDGVPQVLSANEHFYRFHNINQSHHIKVVYEKGYDITTEAVHGLIDSAYTGIKPGDSRTIHYEPDEGYMLSTITVDGRPVATTGNLSSYLFSNVQANHHIKVVFIPKYKITTSITHGTITPTVTNIPPGENRTITYSPDSGYYVKSVTVDDRALSVSDLNAHLSSYVFSNIQADHKIHVVCSPYPVITITKQIDTSDVVFAKGAPMFSFKITGTDYLGISHVYYRDIVWSANEAAVSKSVSLKIPPGQYTVSELVSNDWTLQSVSAGSNASVSGKTLTVDTRNADTASGTFLNQMTDWSKYTENGERINPLK